MQQLVNRMIDARRRQTDRDALAARHSRTGLLTQYLLRLAGRIR